MARDVPSPTRERSRGPRPAGAAADSPRARESSADRVVAQNRRARHDYFILETYEAGLALSGTEVKSLREGKASLAEAYATVERDEAWVLQLHIPPYEQGNRWNLDPLRRRKLLLHRAEIAKLREAVARKGQTLVPLRLYFTRGHAKLLIGVAKGKKTYDKRHAIAERDAKREMERARRVSREASPRRGAERDR
jgi:SsrA-binding protein